MSHNNDDELLVKIINQDIRALSGRSDIRYVETEIRRIEIEISKIKDNSLKKALYEKTNHLRRNLGEMKERAVTSETYRNQKHKDLAKQYKQAWNQRSFIWRMFHQKLNPYKQNLAEHRNYMLEDGIAQVSKRK